MPRTLLFRLVAAIVTACLPATAWAATPTAGEATPSPDSLASFVGSFGEEVVQVPSSLAVGPDGSIWITDQGADQLHKFKADGEHVLTFGETGQLPGQFEFADFGSVGLDGRGNVYVLDTGNQRVQKFTPDLDFELAWGENGVGPGKFLHPTELAVRDDGTVFVVDGSDAANVQQFDSTGTFVQEIVPTDVATQFFEPTLIGLDPVGNLYVPDITRVYVFDRAGRHIRTIRTNEIDNGTVGFLHDVAIADSGFMYASDMQFNNVAVFDPDGQYLGAWGEYGTGNGQFGEAANLVIDDAGRLLVLDYVNHRIQVFELANPDGATPAATPS